MSAVSEFQTAGAEQRKARSAKLAELRFLRPTRHKTGHFGDVPRANLLPWYGKTKPNTTKARLHQ